MDRVAQKNPVGAHSICARGGLRRRKRARADMESAPTILFSTKGRKLHHIYYFLFIIYYFEKRRCSLSHDTPGIYTGSRAAQRH